MIRTQIYLPEHLHEALKEKARKQRTTLAEIIRKAVEKDSKLKQPRKQRSKLTTGGEFLLWLADRAEKEGWEGPEDLSVNTDHYLYGAPKKSIKVTK